MPVKRKAINPDKLLEKIRAAFPDLQWQKYKFIHQGFDHDVIILDGQTVFRFPRTKQYIDRLPREIRALEKLQATVSATIPRYKLIPRDGSFAGYTMIEGRTLSRSYVASLDQSTKKEIAHQLGSFLAVLHRVDVETFSALGVSADDMPIGWQPFFRQKVDQFLRSRLSSTELATVEEILSQVDQLVAAKTPTAVVHADITPRHLLWDGERNQLGIIDFSDLAIGDPAYDFAELFLYGAEFLTGVLAAYPIPSTDNDFLGRARIYQRRSGVAVMVTSMLNPEKVSFAKAKAIFDAIEESRSTYKKT